MHKAAEVFDQQRVPFEVACRVLKPYASARSTSIT